MVAMGKKIMEKFENVEFIGCAAHILNLLTQDVLKIDEIGNILSSAKAIVQEIRNSH